MDAARAPLFPGVPLLGSAPALRRDQLGTLESAMRQHGDVVRFVCGPPGVRVEFYAMFHPDAVQHVLVDRVDCWRKDNPAYVEMAALFGDGLLTSQDDRWRRQRRLLAPLFTRRRLAEQAEVMADEARALIPRWRTLAAEGRPVDLHAEMVRYTMRVLARVLFGADVEAVIPRLAATFPVLQDAVVRRVTSPSLVPRAWPTPHHIRVRRAQRELYAVADELIAARQQVSDRKQNDLLAQLLTARDPDTGEHLSANEIRDQVLIFLLAGHDTTATTLTCALHELGAHPEYQDVIAREATDALADGEPTLDTVDSLPVTQQVIKETLRLYPPAYLLGRLTPNGDEVTGWRFPPETTVLLAPWATHRHPRFWDDPYRFDPARFAPEASAGRHRYAWFPFGAGPRACIGLQFALTEAAIALGTLVAAYHVQPPPKPITVTPGITLMAGETLCNITTRTSSPAVAPRA